MDDDLAALLGDAAVLSADTWRSDLFQPHPLFQAVVALQFEPDGAAATDEAADVPRETSLRVHATRALLCPPTEATQLLAGRAAALALPEPAFATKRRATFHEFVLTREDSTRTYVACLTSDRLRLSGSSKFEALPISLELAGAGPRGPDGAPLPLRRVVALMVMSLHPILDTLRTCLYELYLRALHPEQPTVLATTAAVERFAWRLVHEVLVPPVNEPWTVHVALPMLERSVAVHSPAGAATTPAGPADLLVPAGVNVAVLFTLLSPSSIVRVCALRPNHWSSFTGRAHVSTMQPPACPGCQGAFGVAAR